MKYVVLAGVLAFTLCAGLCEAEDGKGKVENTSGPTAAGKACNSTGLKHIDLGDDNERPVNQVGVMSPGQNYDDSTGFPNIVKSDSDMDLQ